MIKLNTSRILVPFDFSSTSKKALKHAAVLAKTCNGEIHLLYVRKPKSFVNLGHSIAELRQIASETSNYKKLLEATAKEIRDEYKVQAKVMIGVGRRIASIITACEKKGIGLVVMGTEGSDSVSNLFSGSNSHQVVSRSPIPVITVKNDMKGEGYSNIVVPVDTTEHSRQKIVAAIQLAKAFKSVLHVLGLVKKTEPETEAKLKTIVKQIEKRLYTDEISFTSEIMRTSDPAARTMSYAKRKKADMIIAMTDQGPAASVLTPRSYDHELVEESGIPVLSVPPEIHEENIEPASIGGLW